VKSQAHARAALHQEREGLFGVAVDWKGRQRPMTARELDQRFPRLPATQLSQLASALLRTETTRTCHVPPSSSLFHPRSPAGFAPRPDAVTAAPLVQDITAPLASPLRYLRGKPQVGGPCWTGYEVLPVISMPTPPPAKLQLVAPPRQTVRQAVRERMLMRSKAAEVHKVLVPLHRAWQGCVGWVDELSWLVVVDTQP